MVKVNKREIATTYRVIPPEGAVKAYSVDWPLDPGFRTIKEVVIPILREVHHAADLEHVSVLFDGSPSSMFVDSIGAMLSLPVNRRATEIYWTHGLTRNPAADTTDWPRVFGTVVLFTRNVWF